MSPEVLVKSPESHLARSQIAQNQSYVARSLKLVARNFSKECVFVL